MKVIGIVYVNETAKTQHVKHDVLMKTRLLNTTYKVSPESG